MKLSSMLVSLLLSIPAAAAAQPADLANDLTGYTRFLVYPHLQRGRESMERGERNQALAEFERARDLAPDNAGVALYLAAAYRKFGDAARAEAVLLQQLRRTPNDVRLHTALANLRPGPPAGAASPATPCERPLTAGCPGASAASPHVAR